MSYQFNAQPCNDCPYKLNAPLQKWHKSDFKKLLANENDTSIMKGAVYGCHKNNGLMCGGWLTMQDKDGLPCIPLRIALTKQNISREQMDELDKNTALYATTIGMIKANYPDLIKPSPRAKTRPFNGAIWKD